MGAIVPVSAINRMVKMEPRHRKLNDDEHEDAEYNDDDEMMLTLLSVVYNGMKVTLKTVRLERRQVRIVKIQGTERLTEG